MARGSSDAASASVWVVVARVVLLVLNLATFGLGITLLVLGTTHSAGGLSDLLR
jgi:hypothetical protein